MTPPLTALEDTARRPTFRNPLYERNFADPFVLKFDGRYYAYGTPGRGGLPVLRSTNLVAWEDAGVVLGPPEPGLAHWAPEVAYDNGAFFLYYSTGGQEGEAHQVRVARGTSPTGPFDDDLGVLDEEDPFTIDAHPFRDDDGQWYLFYSRDFLDGDFVGTGIVVDRLRNMSQLAGERKIVMRPNAEWHLYERQRRWYDRVWDWYTVEGPFVRKREGRYWCFYSGGAWKDENYGISSAVADHPMGPYEPVVAADTADVLRTVPGKVIGPGHGSVAVAPDNVSEYLVYHAWDLDHTGRFLHTDRLLWEEGRPRSPGPSVEPQPLPPEPTFRDLFDDGSEPPGRGDWFLGGGWERGSGRLRHPGGGAEAIAALATPAPRSYLLEVNVAAGARPGRGGAFGVTTWSADDERRATLVIDAHRGELRWRVVRGDEEEGGGTLARLPEGFRAEASHQLLLRHEAQSTTVILDEVGMGSLPGRLWSGERVGVWTVQTPISVGGVALTALGENLA